MWIKDRVGWSRHDSPWAELNNQLSYLCNEIIHIRICGVGLSRRDSPWAQLDDDISLDIQGMKTYET